MFTSDEEMTYDNILPSEGIWVRNAPFHVFASWNFVSQLNGNVTQQRDIHKFQLLLLLLLLLLPVSSWVGSGISTG